MAGSTKRAKRAGSTSRGSSRSSASRRRKAPLFSRWRLLIGTLLIIETVWLGLFIRGTGAWLPPGAPGGLSGAAAESSAQAEPGKAVEAEGSSIDLPSLSDVGELLMTEEQRDSRKIREMLSSGDSDGVEER